MTAVEALDLEAIAAHYQALSALVSLRPIRSEQEYDRVVATLDQLLDSGAAHDDHPLAELVDILGDMIATYEAVHYPLEDVPASATLSLLMEQHGLTSEDLPEIGSSAEVAEVLNGACELNVSQINALTKRFNVPGAVFLAS
jgi:HTH-type transcriptional regulator/antitoxin HigA